MTNPVIRITKEEAAWRVWFGGADNRLFLSRAEALAAALGRAAAENLTMQVIEVDPPAGERTRIVGDNGAARMDWVP